MAESESEQTPHISPSRASYEVPIEKNLRENWPRYNGTALYLNENSFEDPWK